MSRRDQKMPPEGYKVLALFGVGDIVMGLALLAAGLAGVLGDDLTMPLSVVGGVMAATGAGIAIWARSKLDGGAR
jgi:hypothetical protein